MMKRWSVEWLLKSIVGLLAVVAVVSIGVRAWDIWGALARSERILTTAYASEDAFRAMTAIRSDRSGTPRAWNADAPAPDSVRDYLHQLQTPEMNALAAAAARLETLDFADRDTLLPALRGTQQRLLALQTEFWEGVGKPKAQRRPALAAEYTTEGVALQTVLEKISARIFASIRHADPFVDQMLAVKQLAWIARDRAGEASVLISRGLEAGKLPPEARNSYDTNLGGAAAAWAGIEGTVFGTALPEQFTSAMAEAKRVFFAADYVATRDRLLTALIAHEPAEMTADQWSPYTVPKLGSMQKVAAGALSAAREHARTVRETSEWQMALFVALLLGTAALAAFSLIAVTRRVTGPLHKLSGAMRRLAGGDHSVQAPYTDRHDEIGELATALAGFHAAALDKARIEAEQAEQRGKTAARQQELEVRIQSFQGDAGDALAALNGASLHMGHASLEMAAIAGRTTARVRTVATAAQNASGSVAGIAAATEELSASIADMSRQVARATDITGRAVEETRQTDGTVRGLSEAAAKIGDVVSLINDIAGQTNLLALNATIEAARAGEAGKGFAVVASEVKSLANQTARATEEIAAQIATVRAVTSAAVDAIRQIGATIGDVSAVATSIAAGMQEQGAATQEIARGTQEAARLTQELTDSVTGVSTDAEAAGSTAEAVKSSAATLKAQADQLQERVENFLNGIRAA